MVNIQTTPEERSFVTRTMKDMTGVSNRDLHLIGGVATQRHIGGTLKVPKTPTKFSRIDGVNGLTVFVFTAKTIELGVEPHYTARVYTDNPDDPAFQEANIFFFTRSRRDITALTLVGWITPSQFFREAVFNPAGAIDPHGGHHCFRDEFSIPVSSLNSPDAVFSR